MEQNQSNQSAQSGHPFMRDGRMRMAIITAFVLLSLFLLAQAIVSFETIGTVGEGIVPQNTITVSGTGVAYANPDVAQVTFDVSAQAQTVAVAQTNVTTSMNNVLAYLKTEGVADADVQTTGYNITPQYDYLSQAVICPVGAYCTQPSGKQTFEGYDVTDSVTVNIRDLSNAGTILAGIGSRGVTNLSGLNFTVSDPDTVNDQAQALAITDAKSQATVLANELGVKLVRIVSFSTSNNMPIFYAATMSAGSASGAVAPTPVIPSGQNKVTSNVSITYEIK